LKEGVVMEEEEEEKERRVGRGALYRGAQTAVFELDIRISNSLYIDVCQSLASETGLKSRNVEKRINAV
jgi:hypothetical protein